MYFLHGLPAAATSYRGADFLARAGVERPQGDHRRTPGRSRRRLRPRSTSTGAPGGTGRRRSRVTSCTTSTVTSARFRTGVGARSSASPRAWIRRGDPCAPPPGGVLGDGVMERLLPSDRPCRRAGARSRLGAGQREGECALLRRHLETRLRASPDVLCVLRRPRRRLASAPRTGVSTASSQPRMCRTCSVCIQAVTSRACGLRTRRPGSRSPSTIWPPAEERRLRRDDLGGDLLFFRHSARRRSAARRRVP